MLYHLLYPLHEAFTIFNVFRYITFRTIYAVLTALLITLIMGPWFIRKLRSFNVKQHVREDGPATHINKQGTPTMGGILILFSFSVGTLLWGDLTNLYVWLTLLTTWGLGVIGFIDDMKKRHSKSPQGISARFKICGQVFLGLLLGTFLYLSPEFDKTLTIPFFKEISVNLGVLYIPFVILIIVGTSNAVNLTDGQDGLAIGLVLIVSVTYLLFSYFAGHSKIASYLQILYIPGSGELTVFCGALLGAATGFLWFNTYPAQVFMGDVGSLALGGAIGTVAIISKHEMLLAIVGGIFVAEALSVIFQVLSYKLRKKRIFHMAPLHHHYELKGWAEPKITVRFWIVGAILALVAMSTLKLR
ncbi:MAG: phospho-N-acetylmuramoyl-pentapeptide-transferase [Thermodesulfobacteriota bacterium]|nr:phospho-N-acetylmuramoyl-pentapeptide-transferase [Thermodesulfobacteriota bacterium]